MSATFHLSVVAPDRSVAELEVQSITAPGIEGYFGVWAGHQPTIAALKAGLVEYRAVGEIDANYVAIGGGFAEVSAKSVTILADEAHLATEIDLSKAERELEEALKALKGEPSNMTSQEATQAVERAMARIRAAKKAQ